MSLSHRDRAASEREGDAPAEPKSGVRLGRSLALPVRRGLVHGIKQVDGQPTIIFETLCVKHRHRVLACDAFHRVFREVAAEATAWLVGRYVLMPDHVHLFAGDCGGNVPYENWVTYLKSQITKRWKAHKRVAVDEAARKEPRPADFRWLPDHWDTRVRNAAVYEEKWQYVLHNPVRAKLVAKASHWPYQGEVFELPWR